MTTGILLSNFGGPRNLEEIPLVLRDLFADPDIFQTPLGSLGQKALAELIVYFRTPRVQHAYRRIGGKSPIFEITTQQASAVGALLQEAGREVVLAVGMRYGQPSLEVAAQELLDQGVDRILLVPLYPHYSISTTGSTLNEMRRVMARLAPGMSWDYVPPFPTNRAYVQAVADSIRGVLREWDDAHLTQNRVLMFSAHGLPQSFVDEGDPYPKQVRGTVEAVLTELEYAGRNALTFQSRVGPVEWLKPYTDEAIVEWADQGVDGIIAVPIAFVADNLESLEEINCEYRQLARECGIEAFVTVPCLNADTAFVELLRDLIVKRLDHPGPVPSVCTLPGRRPQPQLIGLRELETETRTGRSFVAEQLRVTAPWWKAIRRGHGRTPLIALEKNA